MAIKLYEMPQQLESVQYSAFITEYGNNNDKQALGCGLHSVMDLRALDCSEGFLQVVKIPFLFPK